jgi:hypothetical protein
MKRNCRSTGLRPAARWATRAGRLKTPRLLNLPSYNHVFVPLFPKPILGIEAGFLDLRRHAIVTFALESGQSGVI